MPESAELQQFLDRITAPDATHLNAYRTLIDGLVTDAIWTLIDGLYVISNSTATTYTNLKSSLYNATANGTITFVSDRGLTSNGTTGYLNTNFNPLTAVGANFLSSGDAGFLAIYSRTDTTAGFQYDIHSGGNASYIVAKFSGSGTYAAIGGAGPGNRTGATYEGQYLVSRISHDAAQLYKSGALYGALDTTPAIGGSTTNIGVLGTVAGTDFSPRQICMAAWGGPLFDSQAYKFMARVNEYMVAIGASVYTTPTPPADTTHPSVTINKGSAQPDPTTANIVTFTAIFNEPVTGFTNADVSFSTSTCGGTLSAVVTGGPTTYSVVVTGMNLPAGNVIATVPVSVCVDLAGNPNDASTSTDNIVAWSPPAKIVPREITMVTPSLIRVEVRDAPVTHGYTEVLSSPDAVGGANIYPITGAVNNGHGLIRLTTTYAASVGALYISAMTSSPVSNGAGGQRIRCTVFDTTLLPVSTRVKIYHALGTTEANAIADVDQTSVAYYPYWSIAIIDATHFDLKFRMHYVASVLTEDATMPSAFVNTYLGNGCVMDGNDSLLHNFVASLVGGCTEANAPQWPARSGTSTIDCIDSAFVNTYTSGGQIIPCGTYTTSAYPRTNPTTSATENCYIVGRESKQRRFNDLRSVNYLDRAAALVAANYGLVGSRTITSVYHKSTPYSGGLGVYPGNAAMMPAVAFRHYLYLQLDGNLANGSYTIDFPSLANIQDSAFVFNDKTTRCCAIKADQNGHRPADTAKLAYLSEWIPGKGTYGEIDFSAVTTWSLINAAGTVVWTAPGAPALRGTPTSVEYASTNPAAAIVYPIPIELKVTNVTNANPARVTLVDASSISNGNTVMFTGMFHQNPGLSGDPTGIGIPNVVSLDYQFLTVSNKSGNSFDINLDTTTYHAFDTSTTGDQGNLCYKCNTSGNRAGTNVYGLDYSAFTAAGTYYIYIPGYGVSDPIRIRESAWFQVLHVYQSGLYNQRTGCALDGRFGYTRPVTMKNRAEQPVRKSNMPYVFAGYANLGIANLDIGLSFESIGGGFSPWITTNTIAAYGGHMDAGDWDTRIYECAPTYYEILDIFDRVPSAGRMVDTGVPTCLEMGLDPTTFAGTDALPGPLAEVIWGIEFARQSQETSGSGIGAIWGGINYGEGVPNFVTSWNTHNPMWAYYPDHLCTYLYAGIAAKLAKILNTLGYSALSTTYQTSAVAAFTWAESIYNRSSSTARDAWYLPMKTRAQWTTTQYNTAITNSQTLDGSPRAFAAACLFALTGTGSYKTICDAMLPFGSSAPREADPMWEYCNAVGADATKRTAIRSQLAQWGLNGYAAPSEATDAHYANVMQVNIYNMGYGGGNDWSGNMGALTKAAMIYDTPGDPLQDATKAARCRAAIQRAMQHRHGANQTGFCLINGLGLRNMKEALHLDSRYFNQDVPKGIPCYGWSNLFAFPLFLIFGTGPISRVQHPQTDPETIALDPDTAYRELYPYDQTAWPRWEMIIEYNTAIVYMEYTTQQNILPGYVGALYLHAFDGNTDTTLDDDVGPVAAYTVQRPLIRLR